jgi:hypothetical protein
MRLQEYEKSKAESAEARTILENQKATQKRQAHMGGSAAAESGITQLPDGRDLSKMSPKEIVESGVYPVSTTDPPRFDD